MKNLFLSLFDQKPEWESLIAEVWKKKGSVAVTGLLEQQRVHMAHVLRRQYEEKIIYVVSQESEGKRALEAFRQYNERAVFIFMEEIHFYSIQAKDRLEEAQLIADLALLLDGEYDICIVTIDALMRKFMPLEVFRANRFYLTTDTSIALDQLSQKLVSMGYTKEHKVEGVGQFSIRGGIVDIFSPGQEFPVRIEFFDDEVDSIRSFDCFTQKSIAKLSRVEILPAVSYLYDSTNRLFDGRIDDNDLSEDLLQDIVCLQEKTFFSDLYKYANFLYPEKDTRLFSYLKEATLTIINDPQRIFDHAINYFEEFSDRFQSAFEKGLALKSFGDLIWHPDYIRGCLEEKMTLLQSYFPSGIGKFSVTKTVPFDAKEPISFQGNLPAFLEELRHLIAMGYKVLLTAENKESAQHLFQLLTEENVVATRGVHGDFQEEYPVFIVQSQLKHGFIYINDKVAVYTPSEIYKSTKKQREKKRKNYKGKKIENFIELNVGDYVVHESYGIGRFISVEQKEFDGIKKDYIKILYNGGDALYVPLEQMEKVQKFIGNSNGESVVRLSKLGTSDWKKAKSKAQKAVEEIAKELVELYAKRENIKGFSFSQDTIWQKQFEEDFPFEETQDQLHAITETKRDMEKSTVMDRLICGDVGYGKTEVAIRAIFKACMDSMQCAFLVPTTILAQQHYRTLSERFKNYPIRVEVLSRFRKKSDMDLAIKDLERGRIDIVVGTHRLLSKDVRFRKLGLLIIDEEQRFGVKDKEKIKQWKNNLDVLTLSATPIPRTLHLSLSGIRDMSLLEEPPHDRLPVMTYVTEAKEGIIMDAIERELSRGGQVFFVYNRVESIDSMRDTLQKLLPHARIAVGHGQMSSRHLESIMVDFLDREYDILLSTTIIETGMDIANANTIIVYNADHMGLSQLYQLRGRVGRSSRQGFAYFMYQKEKVLSEVSEKRLKTIKEFTEFGSGFKIAMRDLEIRGAGNVLGERQHGHMGEIGYELYINMLGKEIKRLTGTEEIHDVETEIAMNLNAYIPEDYVDNEQDKIEMYKKIATLNSKEDLYDLEEELEDRFSTIPKPVFVLLHTAYIRFLGRQLKIGKITKTKNKVQFYSYTGNLITEQFFREKDDYDFMKKIASFLERMI